MPPRSTPKTSSVSSEIDYWRDYSVIAKLADWGIRGHMGFLFGLLNQLAAARRRARTADRDRARLPHVVAAQTHRGSAWALGRPPLRGGIRRLHPVAIVALLVAAVGVGWFLPLLGLTLAAFVVVDLIVGAVKARRSNASRQEADSHA